MQGQTVITKEVSKMSSRFADYLHLDWNIWTATVSRVKLNWECSLFPWMVREESTWVTVKCCWNRKACPLAAAKSQRRCRHFWPINLNATLKLVLLFSRTHIFQRVQRPHSFIDEGLEEGHISDHEFLLYHCALWGARFQSQDSWRMQSLLISLTWCLTD